MSFTFIAGVKESNLFMTLAQPIVLLLTSHNNVMSQSLLSENKAEGVIENLIFRISNK